ncbi:unnamed protein product [Moneuplotes crassus]|uniref:Partial AB-hydrolase lipase domain-containing protein n=1 Tax=Euplotes crassus TaxID=5936 RepID=A0AAD1UIP2_EUPCR|nr:unnamed protein product [Moneuplotes crassus]
MTVRERAETLGFGYEEYQVTTQDGYILTLMRIPNGPESPSDIINKEPILMSHGAFAAAEIFTNLGEVDSSSFYLANQGKDVWLYNIRGNIYSREHVSLDPASDDEYWEFYMDTVRYDYMACVDFILDITGYSQTAILADSLGGATLGIALALEPEYFSSRTSIVILMTPALMMRHTNAPIYTLLGNYPWILETVRMLGINVVGDDNYLAREISHQACLTIHPVCSLLFSLFVADKNLSALDDDSMDIFLPRSLNGVAIRVLEHLFQSIRTSQLTYFDLGVEGNLEAYGTELPPQIPLENINTPLALMWGEFDGTIVEHDAQWMRERLDANIIFDHTYEGQTHITFQMGNDIEEINEDIIELMSEYPASSPNT